MLIDYTVILFYWLNESLLRFSWVLGLQSDESSCWL